MQNWKDHINQVRPGAYPDLEAFLAEQNDIEKTWPAYAETDELCRPSKDLCVTSNIDYFRSAYDASVKPLAEPESSIRMTRSRTFGHYAALNSDA